MKTLMTILTFGILFAVTLTGCQSVYVTSAKVYLQQNDLDNAREQLLLGLQKNPRDAQAHFLLGEIYARQKMYSEMISTFNASLAVNERYKSDIEEIREKHFRDHYNNAVEHFNNQRIDQAIEELRTVTLIDPGDQEGWALLGKSHVRNEQPEEAIAALTRAIELDPNFEKMDDRILLMEMYYSQEQFQEALNAAMEILRQDSANKEAIRMTAFCYNQLGLPEKAIEYYLQALENQPDDSDLVFNLGLLYEQMERYDDALTQFHRAFELNPEDKEAILHCAQTYLERREDNLKAIECFKKAIELDPDNPEIWNNLGIAQIRAGQEGDDAVLIEEGKVSIQKAAELRGETP